MYRSEFLNNVKDYLNRNAGTPIWKIIGNSWDYMRFHNSHRKIIFEGLGIIYPDFRKVIEVWI